MHPSNSTSHLRQSTAPIDDGGGEHGKYNNHSWKTAFPQLLNFLQTRKSSSDHRNSASLQMDVKAGDTSDSANNSGDRLTTYAAPAKCKLWYYSDMYIQIHIHIHIHININVSLPS